MAVNKVEINGESIIDLTDDTVSADTLLEGYTAHDSSGEVVTGKLNEVPMATSAKKVENALTFTGAVDTVYDGSSPESVSIPEAVAVKGNAEGSYRTGNVNLTPENIGALGYIKAITASDDLNKLIDPGVYYFETGAVPANSPYENAAIVEVLKTYSDTTALIQRVTRFGITGHTSFRTLTVNKWTDWVELALKSDLTPANIGAVSKTGDTMSGNLTVNGTSDIGITYKRPSINEKAYVGFDISTAPNFGVYVNNGTTSNWLVRMNSDGDIYMPGQANTANTLTTARTINGVSFNGSSNITVYDSTKVAKTGDTMTGNFTVKHLNGPAIHCINESNGKETTLTVANSGNRGVYDDTSSKWLIHFNGNDIPYVNGIRVPEIQYGSTTITPTMAGQPEPQWVGFPRDFSGTPKVVVTANTTVPGTSVLGVGIDSVDKSMFRLFLTRTNSVSTVVSWIAVY